MSWAALAVWVFPDPFAPLALVPLLVLAAGFETGYALHVAVERVGRYVFVFFESPAEMPKWETAIAAFGQSSAAQSTGGGALLVPVFILAALVNLLLTWPMLSGRPAGTMPALTAAALVGAHAIFVARVFSARARARRQRPLDTAAFRAIAADLGRPQSPESN